MSSTISIGKRTFTTDAICEQLSNSDLLPHLLREMIVDEILADWEIELDGKIPYSRAEFQEGCDRLSKLVSYQGLNQLQLYKIVDRHLGLKKFKDARWSSRVYSHYLQRKSAFDRVEFSLMTVKDRGLAEEIFFRVQSGEQSFADLAFKYSEDESAKDGGKISSPDLNLTHAEIAPYLVSLQQEKISQIFILNNLHAFVRLEGYISAELDDSLNQILIDELFETWVQQQISSRLGLFEIEADLNIAESIPIYEPIIAETKLIEPSAKLATNAVEQFDNQTELSELIEPSSSFFFPKEVTNLNYDFEDPADGGSTSSFFFPKDTPAEIIRNNRRSGNSQKLASFLLLFSIFLGLEIMAFNLFHRTVTPQLDVGRSQLR